MAEKQKEQISINMDLLIAEDGMAILLLNRGKQIKALVNEIDFLKNENNKLKILNDKIIKENKITPEEIQALFNPLDQQLQLEDSIE